MTDVAAVRQPKQGSQHKYTVTVEYPTSKIARCVDLPVIILENHTEPAVRSYSLRLCFQTPGQLMDIDTETLWQPSDPQSFSCAPTGTGSTDHELPLFPKHFLLCVSRQWRNVLQSIPSLWRELDFSRPCRLVPLNTVKAYLARSKRTVRIIVCARATFERGASNHLIANSPKLEHLELMDGIKNPSLLEIICLAQCLTTIILKYGPKTCLNLITQLLGSCRTLVHAEFHRVLPKRPAIWNTQLPNLRTLYIFGDDNRPADIGLLDLNSLVAQIPNIRRLKIISWDLSGGLGASDFSSLRSLESLDYEGFPPNHNPILPPSVRDLRLVTVPGLAIDTLPNLTSLSVPYSENVRLSELYAILQPGKGNLKNLTLGGHTQSDFVQNLCLRGFLPKIESLKLLNSSITDDSLRCLAVYCLRLECLVIRGNTNVTDVGIKAVVLKEGKRLKHLGLWRCSKVGANAIYQARARGINVEN